MAEGAGLKEDLWRRLEALAACAMTGEGEGEVLMDEGTDEGGALTGVGGVGMAGVGGVGMVGFWK